MKCGGTSSLYPLVDNNIFSLIFLIRALSQFVASLYTAKIHICVTGNLKLMAHFYYQLLLYQCTGTVISNTVSLAADSEDRNGLQIEKFRLNASSCFPTSLKKFIFMAMVCFLLTR